MESESGKLSARKIEDYLQEYAGSYHMHVYDTLPSTNTALKALASQGAPAGTVIIADTQTAGRGRMGRSFSSPPGTGLYMSVLLRPDLSAEDMLLITPAAAVAAAEAIEAVSAGRAGIKWVNDIWIDGLKVCGILSEAAFKRDGISPEYAILGIGINVYEPEGGFPEELAGIAGSLFGNAGQIPDIRNRLTAEILIRTGKYCTDIMNSGFIDKYRERSVLTGKKVYNPADNTLLGTVISIDDRCRLIVRTDDGETRVISSGDISVRPLK